MAKRHKSLTTAALTEVLIDTGPLLAMIDLDDPAHNQVVAILKQISARRLMTTWPCVTEAMYLLGKLGGHTTQDVLWDYLLDNLLQIHDLSLPEQERMRELMARYADTPMDLADASLVVTAESLNLRQIITLDSDFYLYRLAGGSMLEVLR